MRTRSTAALTPDLHEDVEDGLRERRPCTRRRTARYSRAGAQRAGGGRGPGGGQPQSVRPAASMTLPPRKAPTTTRRPIPTQRRSEIDAAGQQAGEDRVFKSYQDGKVTQSTIDPVTDKTRDADNDSLGKTWDNAESRETLRRARCLGALLSPRCRRRPAQRPHRSGETDGRQRAARQAGRARQCGTGANDPRSPHDLVDAARTPFLRNGLIFRVDWRGPYKTVSRNHRLRAAEQRDRFLAASPENFDASSPWRMLRSRPTNSVCPTR